MCIIIAKYRNGRLPNKNELKNSFEYNSDGAGFMYVDNGKVIIDKGYMTYESFIDRFDELCKKYNDFNEKSLVIHCRIGTSSSNTAKNTHPYPLSRKEKNLHKTYIKTDLGVVHNGIISQYTPHWKNPTTNDTQEFIIKYLTPLYENYKQFYKNKFIMNGIKNIINSKLVFLDTNDRIYFVGKDEFIEEDKGLFFSNDSYKYNIYFTRYYNDKYNNNYDDLYEKWAKEYEKYEDKNDFDYCIVYNEDGNKTGKIIYYADLEFLDNDDYIYSIANEEFKEIGNNYTAFDVYDYNLYEIVDDKAYLIGNIFDDEIEIFSNKYEKII